MPFPTSLYLHIPFCLAKCHYCDFVVRVLQHSQQMERYLAYLFLEIQAISPYLQPLKTLYMGGGTPSLLPLDALAQLAGLLPRTSDCEWTLEVNPETVTPQRATAWRELGINRISLGVQSFVDELLIRCGRTHTAHHAITAYRLLQAAGFANIGLDLIYGLPGQTPATWHHTLAQAVLLQPQHLSLYALQIEAQTLFGYQEQREHLVLPVDDLVVADYDKALQELEQAGYQHYEISNWAKPGYASRHNLVYWRSQPCWGIGVGAHGYWQNRRYANPETLLAYYRVCQQQDWAWQHTPPQSTPAAMEEFMFLGLRLLQEGIQPHVFAERFGTPLQTVYGNVIQELLAQGYLVASADALRLQPEAVLISNEIFQRFLLDEPPGYPPATRG